MQIRRYLKTLIAPKNPVVPTQGIFRIEKDGRGPYHTGDFNDSPWRWYENQKWYHPLPEDDAALKKRYIHIHEYQNDDVFGFGTVEEYYKWFNHKDWRRKMEKQGFMLVNYEATNVTYGEGQVMFSRATATKMAQYSPTHFDEIFGVKWEIR